MATTTKILLFNTGYCTGLDGSLRDYVLHCCRYLRVPRRIFRRVLKSVDGLVDREKPDLCCFTEVRGVARLVRVLWDYPFHHFANKYGKRSVFRRLPFFRRNCMGFFADRNFPFHKHYLRNGTKKLVYEIRLDGDTSLIMGHLSLRRKTRMRQLRELQELVGRPCRNPAGRRRHVILCGDFNVFRGMGELRELLRSCRLRVVNTLKDATFPAIHPEKAIDLFLCSEGMDIAGLEVLPVHASDHLPVLLEVRL